MEKTIKVGICAMEKKVNSKHMQFILKGLEDFGDFTIIVFTEEMLFNLDIEDWPICNALIIFFSNGFPYTKALKYINLRKPFLINDFEAQKIFWDRRKVYSILEENKIPTPYHIVVDRGEEINNDGEIKPDKTEDEEIENMINKYYQPLKSKDNKDKDIYSNKMNINSKINLQENINKINNFNNDFSTTSLVGLEEKELGKSSPIFKKRNSSNVFNDEKVFNCANSSNNNLIHIDSSVCPSEFRESLRDNILGESYASDYNGIDNPNGMVDEIEKNLIEYDDHIEFNGKKLFKPFVEKPANGDDHNIYIYYPPSLGGAIKDYSEKQRIYLPCIFLMNAPLEEIKVIFTKNFYRLMDLTLRCIQ